MGKKLLTIVLLLIIITVINGQETTSSMKDSLKTENNTDKNIEKVDDSSILLLIENKKLENDINIANRLIESQNSQITETRNFFTYFIGILGIILAVVGFIRWKDINEIKEVKTDAQRILENVNSEIQKTVINHYNTENNKAFNQILNLLKEKNKQNLIANGLLKNYAGKGLNSNQRDQLKQIIISNWKSTSGNQEYSGNTLIAIFESLFLFGIDEKEDSIFLDKMMLIPFNRGHNSNTVCRVMNQYFIDNYDKFVRGFDNNNFGKIERIEYARAFDFRLDLIGSNNVKEKSEQDFIKKLQNSKKLIEELERSGLFTAWAESYGDVAFYIIGASHAGIEENSILHTKMKDYYPQQ